MSYIIASNGLGPDQDRLYIDLDLDKGFDPDQDQPYVDHDLDQTVCKCHQQMTKIATSKERV